MSSATPLKPLARPQRRGLGLIRVSKEREGMTSPEVQRHAIQQHADQHGIVIVDWVEGIDESGSRSQSAWWPKLDASVARIESGEADVIVVWKFSRVGRSRVRWAVALDRVDTAGGAIESATEPAEATPSGRLQRGLMGEFNAYQAELIGESWREAHERRIRAGLPATGGPRFGYSLTDGTYVIDPETGPILANLYWRYLAGAGMNTLARQLTESGHSGGTHGWTLNGVQRMLDSGFGAGLLGRTEMINGRRRYPPPWERRYSPGAHEPVIDDATWSAYVAERQNRGPVRERSTSPYMLSGLVRCGDCGGAMHGGRMTGRPTYICSRATRTPGVRRVTAVAWRIEEYVERWLFSFAADADAQIAAQAAQLQNRATHDFAARRARARIDKGQERLTALTIKLADGTISDAAYTAAAAAIQSDIDAASAALPRQTPNPATDRAVAQLPHDLESLWPALDIGQRNALLRPLIDHVEIRPAITRGDKSERYRIIPKWEEPSVEG